MSLSIIIVNYRSWTCLFNCLSGLLADPMSVRWQIIVVDNYSNDGQIQSFSRQFRQVEFIVTNRNGGFAYGCNAGVANSDGERLLFLNPDVIPKPGQVQTLLSIMDKEKDVAILSARQVNAKGKLQKTWDVFPDLLTYFKSIKSIVRRVRPGRYPNPRAEHQDLVYCDWVSGAVLLVDRDVFDQIGGWCEDYWMYSEDCDLCYQARLQGLLVACTPEVTFTHIHGGASRRSIEATIRTKTEAIISRHLFNQRNRRGFRRAANHMFIVLAAVTDLLVWSVMDLLTFNKIAALSVRSSILRHVISHYVRVIRFGDWRSCQIASRPGLPDKTA